MNNRYIFRGKRKDNGAWETGFLVITRYDCSDEKYFIAEKMTSYHTPVIPETVGQCTGLKDKNGKWIFEGDIVHFKTPAYHYKNCRIKYQAFYARYCAIDNKGYEYPMDKAFEYEVIGNIYDNPELLEVER